jgi:N-acetylmuramoyl-L-alanine amidase
MDIETYLRWQRGAFPVSRGSETRLRRRYAEGCRPDEPGPMAPLERVERLVVHHSELATGNAALYRWLHRLVNGWADIGYHYVIGNGAGGWSRDGELEPGRPVAFQGAHVRGYNEHSIGICLVGNLDRQAPSPAAYATLVVLLRELLERHGLTPKQVRGHREFPGVTKSCPGRRFDLDELRRTLSAPVEPRPPLPG